MNDDPTPEPDPHNEQSLMGCSSIVFVPLSFTIAWYLITLSPVQDPFSRVVLMLLLDVAVASTLFFGIGFLWSISGNAGLKRILDLIAVKFAWAIIPFLILVVVSTVIAVVMG